MIFWHNDIILLKKCPTIYYDTYKQGQNINNQAKYSNSHIWYILLLTKIDKKYYIAKKEKHENDVNGDIDIN